MICIMIFTRQFLQNGKALSKKSVQYIPVLGWTFKFAEYILLERSYDKDREILTKQVKELVDYPDPMVVSSHKIQMPKILQLYYS